MRQAGERLKARGGLPKGFDVDAFLDRNQVEAYLTHTLSMRGKREISRRFGKEGVFSAKFDAQKFRSRVGTIEEVNAGLRRDIVSMVLKEGHLPPEAQALVQQFLPPGGTAADLPDEALDALARYFKLDEVKLFETDGALVMAEYAQQMSKSLANTELVRRFKGMFPEGDQFAAAARKQGVQQADRLAAAAGYTRLDGGRLAREVFDATAWGGWSKYKDQIGAILDSHTGDDAMLRLMQLFDEAGVPANSLLRQQAKVAVDSVYLPTSIAGELTRSMSPGWWSEVVRSMGVVGEVPRAADEALAFFKTAVTVAALSFHGRNWLSNLVSAAFVMGPQILNPSHHLNAVRVLYGDQAAPMRVGNQIRPIGDVRREAGRNGALDEVISMADVAVGAREHRINIPRALFASALGGTAGGAGGYLTGDDESKIRRAFTGAFVGAFAGAAGSSFYDVNLLKSVRALHQQRWADAGAQFAEDALLSVVPAARVGAYFGALGAAGQGYARAKEERRRKTGHALRAFFMGALEGGAVLGLGAAGSRYAMEGLFALGGGAGRAIENQSRLSIYLAARDKGLSPQAATEIVNRTLFDYGDLTPFERDVVRRLVPFYTWTSKNAFGLQPWLMKNKPKEYSAFVKFMHAAQSETLTDEQMALMSEHFRYRFVLGTGAGRIIAGLGLPIESVADLSRLLQGDNPLPLMRPELQFISKFFFDYDPYRMKDVTEIRSARDIRFLPGPIKRWAGYGQKRLDDGTVLHQTGLFVDPVTGEERVDKALGSYRMAVLQSLPPWRLVAEYNKAAADTFMPMAADGSLGAPATVEEKVVALTTGVKPYMIRWDRAEEQIMRSFLPALQEQTSQLGFGGDVYMVFPKVRPTTR
jgi:hypothetical protein